MLIRESNRPGRMRALEEQERKGGEREKREGGLALYVPVAYRQCS